MNTACQRGARERKVPNCPSLSRTWAQPPDLGKLGRVYQPSSSELCPSGSCTKNRVRVTGVNDDGQLCEPLLIPSYVSIRREISNHNLYPQHCRYTTPFPCNNSKRRSACGGTIYQCRRANQVNLPGSPKKPVSVWLGDIGNVNGPLCHALEHDPERRHRGPRLPAGCGDRNPLLDFHLHTLRRTLLLPSGTLYSFGLNPAQALQPTR